MPKHYLDPKSWQDPPPGYGRDNRNTWGPVIKELTERPGEWAVIRKTQDSASASNTADYLSKRYQLQTTTRKQPDGSVWVYARWPVTA